MDSVKSIGQYLGHFHIGGTEVLSRLECQKMKIIDLMKWSLFDVVRLEELKPRSVLSDDLNETLFCNSPARLDESVQQISSEENEGSNSRSAATQG